MNALGLHLPLMFVMLGAVIWTFIVSLWRPQWFEQDRTTRALWSAMEGGLCGVAWGIVRPLLITGFDVTDVMSPAVAALGWGVMSYYSKGRHYASIHETVEDEIGDIYSRK